MPRLNRGETTKLSIKLSANARANIKKASKNLNLSQAGVIMFGLSHVFKNPPTRSDILNMENNIILEPGNFPITIKKEFSRTIDALQQEHDMPKNKLMGLIISNIFENNFEGSWNTLLGDHDATPKKINVQLNADLKKKITKFSETHYVSLSGIISAAILRGAYKGFPVYSSKVMESFFTNIPAYIYNKVKSDANSHGIPEHFYIELCVYNMFLDENNIFDL